MICDVFVLDILASWVRNHNVLLRIASTLCPPPERWRSSAVISSSTTTGPMSWRWLMLSPKNISRLPSRVSSFRSVVSDEIGVFTGGQHTHMLRTIFPDICQFSRCFDFIKFLDLLDAPRWTVPTWAWAATPSGRISVRPDSIDFSKFSPPDGLGPDENSGNSMEQWGYVGNKIEMMKQFSQLAPRQSFWTWHDATWRP